MGVTSLRSAREELLHDHAVGGRAFGRELARLLDAELVEASAALGEPSEWALVALGSYARQELSPGSDVDVMLLHDSGRRAARGPAADAGRLWYPLWDAGFVLGHSVRTVREATDLADADLDAMTALLDMRVIVGDAELVATLESAVRRLVPKRRGRLISQLASAARARHRRPGPIAEMLEPDLKDGAGGLRDVQAPGWVGWALDPPPGAAPGWAGAVATLVDRGYLHVDDVGRLEAARDQLLDVRVALQRSTGSRSNLLALQDQDVVARMLGAADADVLVRSLGEAARAVAWTNSDMWSRLLAAEEGPRRRTTGYRDLGDGLSLRDGRLALDPAVALDATRVLELAARAATLQCQLERPTLDRVLTLDEVEWTPRARDAFIELLRAGRSAIGVFETLDHVGVLVRLLPEWAHVRARPQRNAYHRFTVDRHSLEAVAECAALLDPADPAGAGLDGEVARRTRADLLLLGALLHDIGKGRPGDHSQAGARTAVEIARRLGVDETGIETLGWLVEHHLLLADTATRRDLGDSRTISRFARAVATTERLDTLYALTIGDSRATGPAAWGLNKAALMRDLWMKTEMLLAAGVVSSVPVADHRAALRAIVGDSADEYLDAMPPLYAGSFTPDVLARHRELVMAGEVAIEWAPTAAGHIVCTLVAPDRTGLLATAAGALALLGVDIVSAAGYSHPDGIAIEVFTCVDRYGRLGGEGERARAAQLLRDAIAGAIPLAERLEERMLRYRRRATGPGDRDFDVVVDLDASAFATVVEVHAPDDVGLLARVAAVFAELEVGVTQAIVSTVGDRVVDVFYLRDANGQKFTDSVAIERVRSAVLARLVDAAQPTLGAT